MALLNFPPNPDTGDTFTIGTTVWQWNGYAWIKYSTFQIGTGTTTISNTTFITTNTNSTGTNSGAMIVSGGVGIASDVNIGGNLHVLSNTESTSTTTGALIVDGGVGIGKNLNVGGQIAIPTAGSTFVLGSSDLLSSHDTSIYFSRSVTGDSASIEAGNITTYSGSAALKFASYSGSGHMDLVTYSGDWGPTGYGVRLRVDGNTGNIKIFNTTSSTSTTTGALQVAGGVGIGGDVYVQGRVNSESLRLADAVLDSTLVVTTASTATVVIDSYSITQFRSAKYLVQIDEGTGPTDRCQVAEILLIVNNAGGVFATEYANLFPGTDPAMGDFYAGYDMFDGSVKLYFTPYDATVKEIVVLRTGLAV
jgi:hypothetical protein